MSFISAMDIINIEIKVRKVEQIMEKIQDMDLRKMLLELEEKLQRVYGNKLKAVILYGSVARGTATEESDIDIMVLVDGTAQELRTFEDQLSDVSTDISIKYFKVFSIIDISYQEYMRWMNTSSFYKNVSQEGVVLYALQSSNQQILLRYLSCNQSSEYLGWVRRFKT